MTDPYNAQDRPHNAQSAPAPNGAYTGGTVSADVEAIKKNALIAMIVGFVCGGVLPGVLGLLGYLKADTEPQTARKFTKWSWIAFAICWAIALIVLILYIVVIAAAVSQNG